ncbi:MAG: 30S ribosomal protein S6 [Planctomycetota bacterium]|jgi:small subunit ribosomal protein S6|nr:30S ribosomal protein S6 [Planctomycetota bacterium]MDP6937744.1 30S ribosomal protein S6 [Planctomycetota bacterium]
MFLIDNDVVREGYEGAKALVTDALDKHGATLLSARRWDERRLAYPIKGRRRATFLITYYQIDGNEFPGLRREFDLSEKVLRYLFNSVDAVPEGEVELAQAEGATDFTVPEPPADDAPDPEPEPEEPEEGEEGTSGEAAPDGAEQASEDAPEPASEEAPEEASPETSEAPASEGSDESDETPEKQEA